MPYIAKTASVGTAKIGEEVKNLNEARAKFLLERGVIVEGEPKVKSQPEPDLDDMTKAELEAYIESKGGEVPEGNKAAVLEAAKAL